MTTENTSKRPSHYVYAVTKHGNTEKAFWTRIGAACPTPMVRASHSSLT